VLSSLPKGVLRDGRNVTPYSSSNEVSSKVNKHAANNDVQQAALQLVKEANNQATSNDGKQAALHLSEEAAVAFASCVDAKGSTAILGSEVATVLEDGRSCWMPGLRPLSRACRTLAEENTLGAWRELHAEALARPADFTFVELFAGIGGFRMGLAPLGGACVLACELDASARDVYQINFGGPPCMGDVTSLDAADVPSHDILTAGFPCQPFAFCNVGNAEATGSLKAGPGVASESGRGALAFEVARILHASRPVAFILENVPNLCTFNDGADLSLLLSKLETGRDEGYAVQCTVLDARQFGVCQQRRRLYFVGFRLPDQRLAAERFNWPKAMTATSMAACCLRDIIEPDNQVPADCWLTVDQWQKNLGED